MYKTKLEIVFFSKTKEKSIVGAGSSFRERVRERERERERERDSSFSLDFRPFGPSVLDEAKSKVDLRGEG